jgi:hypothetical protein
MLLNHEDEVSLRLKFEAKLKEMHTQYRTLEIEAEKNKNLLDLSESQLKRLQIITEQQTKDIIALREERADH